MVDDEWKAWYFPELSMDFCIERLQLVQAQLCAADQNVSFPDLAFKSFQEMMSILSSDVEDDMEYVTCDDAKTCEACLQADHRGGRREFEVTSFPCAWNAVASKCVQAADGTTETSTSQCLAPVGSSEAGSLIEVDGHFSGRKSALLVGFSYKGTASALGGTIPDIIHVFTDLVRDYGFHPSEITVVADDEVASHNFPGANFHYERAFGRLQMVSVMEMSVKDLQPGDFWVFHYAGHGATVPDKTGDELDGQDEIIAMPNGENFLDDDFYSVLLQIPEGVRVTAIADACHSEGFADLPFNYMSRDRKWCTDWSTPRELPKATITYVSGSQNHQTSNDLGNGGALSLHAGREWKRPQPFTEALKNIVATFKRNHFKQFPNVAAWPSFRDTALFAPWDPNLKLERDDAQGGPKPGAGYAMQTPPICSHGYVDDWHVSHERQPAKVARATKLFMVQPGMASARRELAGKIGWVNPSESAQAPPPPEEPEDEPILPTKPEDESTSGCKRISGIAFACVLQVGTFSRMEKFGLHFPTGKSVVDKVRPGTPADRAGILVGDVIVAIGSEDFTNMPSWKRKEVFTSGRGFELTVVRRRAY
eukprot:gnl/TRDRNA2_/TRDRNA2_176644_c0_seq2.p1 gnl/TRDRNA2_/TRDRNA2_176644_c0~~gnl/TRDRNA2_/TRDRNA2_176644_c0_seq2.p1  ORF type:complete len:611 (-),score=72.37 gnl/TRDRNA2_/TRDRNA2_176644_c0_seq2:454-2232(-)